MLERGGNAFDAAVAAGFVLQVVEPHLNGPGGEVPILLYHAERDEVLVVDGQGTAPAAATIERFRELGHELVPGTGLLAACVPGAFDAWLLLLRDFGTLPLAEVLEPALGYAENGYPLVPGIPRSIAKVERVFRDEWPGSAELYLRGPRGRHAFQQSAPWARPTGGCSPSRLGRAQIDAARDAFYRGFVADAIDALPRRAWPAAARLLTATTSPRGGPRSSRRSLCSYEGWEVCKTGAVGPGPGLPAAARAARRLRARRARGAGLRPHGRRVRQARFRRPRGLVRRPCRRAARRAAERGVRGRAAHARRRRGRRASCGPAARAGASRDSHISPARAGRTREPASRPAATRATWTWSTATATRSRPRRAAAGCTAPP